MVVWLRRTGNFAFNIFILIYIFTRVNVSFYILIINPLNANFTKMVKHTQTIRRQIADELFECVWPFCGIGT